MREGSVYRRRGDGLYVATYYDDAGKRIPVTARRIEDAIAKRARAMAGHTADQTLGSFLHWWTTVHLPRRVQLGKLAATTAEDYGDDVRLYMDTISDVALSRLSVGHVEDWIADLSVRQSTRAPKDARGRPVARTLSPTTVAHAHRTLRAALTVARRRKLIADNPAADAEAPSPRKADVTVVSPSQVPAFIAACERERFESLILTLLPLGLRVGEGLAVTLDALDLDAGTVYVGRSLARLKHDKRWLLKTTKNRRDATLALPRFAVDALAKRLEVRQIERDIAGDLWTDAHVVDDHGREHVVELLWCSPTGEALHSNQVNRAMDRICERANVTRLTPHGLRHSCASILAAKGATLLELQGLLRHASGRLTADLYAHLIPEVQQQWAGRWDAIGAKQEEAPDQ